MGLGNRLSRLIGVFFVLSFAFLLVAEASVKSEKDRRDLLQAIWLMSKSSSTFHPERYEQALSYFSNEDFYKYRDFPDILISLIEDELAKDSKIRSVEKIQIYLEKLMLSGDRDTVFPNIDKKDVSRFSKMKSDLQKRIAPLPSDSAFHQLEIGELLDNTFKEIKAKSPSRHLPFLFNKKERQITLDAELLIAEAKKQAEFLRAEREKKENLEKQGIAFDSSQKPFEALLLSKVPKDFGSKEIKAGDANSAELLLAGTSRFITDEVINDLITGDYFEIVGRDPEVKSVINILAKLKRNNAVLVGPAGAGKTAIIEALAQLIISGAFGSNSYTAFLKDAVVVETSTGVISALAKTDKDSGQAFAMETYLKALSEMQEETGRTIIVFIDEVHTLSDAHVEAMKTVMDSKRGKLLFIGASTSEEFRGRFKHNPAFLRRIKTVGVEEFSEEQIFDIIREKYIPYISPKRGHFRISDENIRYAIDQAIYIYPEMGKMGATQELLDVLPLDYLIEDESRKIELSDEIITDFVQKETKLPVDVRDDFAMEEYRNRLVELINIDVRGQERMVNDLVDAWMAVLRNDSSRGVRVIQLMGRSGVGKTEVVKSFAVHALGGKDRILYVNANEFKEANEIGMSVLVGIPTGVSNADKNSGRLLDFVDDEGRGKYMGVILIDESDKASLLFYMTLMRLFDEGRISGRDGKLRNFNRHLIVLTSNAGDKMIFPEEVVNWKKEDIERALEEWTDSKLRALLDGFLPDSVVNRIDKLSLANIITKEVGEFIAENIYNKIRKRYEKKKSIHLVFDPSVFEAFSEAYNPLERGARNFVRSLESQIESALVRYLGKYKRDANEVVDIKVKAEGTKHFLVVGNEKGSFSQPLEDLNAVRCSSSTAN